MTTEQREWLPEGPRWTTDPAIAGGLCRYPHCGRPAVAALRRRHTGRGQWWRYCEDHVAAYGKRIRNARVEAEYLVGSPAHAEALKRRAERRTAL